MLGRCCNARALGSIGIKRCRLMGVLAIAQGLRKRAGKRTAARRRIAQGTSHPSGHSCVISSRTCIGRLRQLLTEGVRRLPVIRIKFGQQPCIVLNIHNDAHKCMIFSRRTDHCGTTDVDILDASLVIATLRNRLLERIKVNDKQIDRAYIVLFHRGDMGLVIA